MTMPLKWRDHKFPALAVLLGLALSALHYQGALVTLTKDVLCLKTITHPDLYQGDPELLKMIGSGFYHFGHRLLGRLLAGLGVQESLLAVLTALQIPLWGLQIFFFFLLAKKITGRDAAALLACLFFSCGVLLFRVTDAPCFPQSEFGRSMGFTLVVPSIYLFFSGRKWGAWILALASVYLHAQPGSTLITLYTLHEGFGALRRQEEIPAFVGRFLLAAACLAPIILGEQKFTGVPPSYTYFSSISIGLFHPFQDRTATDWTLFFQGVLFLLLSWPAFRQLPASEPVRRFFACAALMFGLSWLTRAALYPMGLPLSRLLATITANFPFLFLAEMLGLIVISYALLEAMEKQERPFSPAVIVLALISSQLGDYVLRFWALAIWFALLSGAKGRSFAHFLALAGLAFCWGWQWFGATLISHWMALGRSGGVFMLPAFSSAAPLALTGAFLCAAAGKFKNRTLPLAVLFVCFSALALIKTFPAYVDKPWLEISDWVRRNTPSHSVVFLLHPGDGDIAFSVKSERPSFYPNNLHGNYLNFYGGAAVPYLKRMEDLSYDFSCCRSALEGAQEDSRLLQALTPERIKNFAARNAMTHVVVKKSFNPLKALTPVHENGSYGIYKL